MMVGFIEPVGTSFQSAREERIANNIRAKINSGRISLTHHRRALDRKVALFITTLTQTKRGCSKVPGLLPGRLPKGNASPAKAFVSELDLCESIVKKFEKDTRNLR